MVNGSWVYRNAAVGVGGGIFNVNLITVNASDISSNNPDDCDGC